MEITILYALFFSIILIDILFYLDNLFFDQDSSFYKKRHERNIFNDESNDFKIDLFKRSAIVYIKSKSYIELPSEFKGHKISVIDVKEEIVCQKFVISENIVFINRLRLKADSVISKSSNYSVKDDAIFDKFNNLICIFKEKSFDELKHLAQIYSISSQAVHYFSNAEYNQFVLYQGLFDLRFSKPYTNRSEELVAIVPNIINGHEIEALSLNFSKVNYLNIPSSVKRIIIEKKSDFDNLEIDPSNNYFCIYKNSLLQKNTGIYINDGFNTFNKINSCNKKEFRTKYRLLNRKYLKNIGNNNQYLFANDLQKDS